MDLASRFAVDIESHTKVGHQTVHNIPCEVLSRATPDMRQENALTTSLFLFAA
jgi:hypothetical protein